MNSWSTIVYQDGADWKFSLVDGASKVGVASTTAASPIVVTTSENHSFQTGDKVRHWGVTGDSGILANDGIFTVTRISATQYSLDSSTGVNPGSLGFAAKCLDGTGIDIGTVKVQIAPSHTTTATVLITATASWLDQSAFYVEAVITSTQVANSGILAGKQYARVFYYTQTNGKTTSPIIDDITVISR